MFFLPSHRASIDDADDDLAAENRKHSPCSKYVNNELSRMPPQCQRSSKKHSTVCTPQKQIRVEWISQTKFTMTTN